MKKNTIIISCGGTGGHIFPGLEIAKSLQKQNSGVDILFVGASGRMEMEKVPKAGFKIIGIWIQALYRNSILKNILFPVKFIISLICYSSFVHSEPFVVLEYRNSQDRIDIEHPFFADENLSLKHKVKKNETLNEIIQKYYDNNNRSRKSKS